MMWELFRLNFWHYLRRLSRDSFGILIFVALPLILVYVLSLVGAQNTEGQIYFHGYNMVATHISVGMMLLFQLNGGIYLLNCLNHDFIKPMKWRLNASPCHVYMSVFGAVAACLVFTVAQGILIVSGSTLLMGAYWGNLWITIMVIVIVSTISQLLNIILLLCIRNLSAAEYMSWFLAWSMAVLGGMMFPLPDNAFFRFMRQYGTPFSLARNVIQESGFLATTSASMWNSIVMLVGLTVFLAMIIVLLGRRKLG